MLVWSAEEDEFIAEAELSSTVCIGCRSSLHS